MSLKHIIKYMAVPVVAAFALVGCSHEDFTTAPKSSAEQTETTTKKRTIKLRLSADIELPKGTDGRGIGFNLDPTSDRYRPRINWDAIKDKIQTRLYFRKMVKGAGGKMVASQDRHDIFSVVIKPEKWTLKDPSNGHLKLGVKQLMEIEVPSAPDQNVHPFLPDSEFPKTSPEASPGTNGEWQVAAILSVDLNGDFSKGEDGKFGYDLAQSGGYFPEQYILDKLGTENAYEEHDKEFDDPDLQDAKPFKYDGYWMLYPKTMYFDHDTPNPAKAQTMEIPFCADWKDVKIDENGVVGVQLQATSPGMILHYELVPDDVNAYAKPKSISNARGLSLASRRAKQSFRSPGASIGIEDFTELSQDALDNLKSTACTFYGALWYDQDGDKVHWSRGKINLTEYTKDPEAFLPQYHYYMKENTLSVYVRGASISTEDLDANKHCHILYFVMPPYEGTSAPAGAKTTFWLQPRVQSKQKREYNSDYEFNADQPSDYKYLDLSYKLKKKNGTFQNQYVSTTPLSPGKIHWVRLQYKKLDAPIEFNPDAQP